MNEMTIHMTKLSRFFVVFLTVPVIPTTGYNETTTFTTSVLLVATSYHRGYVLKYSI